MAEPDRSRLAGGMPSILIGRDRRAGWVVTEIHGRCGGLFCDEAAALRFAKEASQGHPERIKFASRPVELKMPRMR